VTSSLLIEIILFLSTGIIAGLLSAIFGIGGGLVVVPALYWAFKLQGMDPSFTMQMAVGTSLAIMIITTINSAWSHHKKGNVIISAVKPMLLSMFIGVILGVIASRFMHAEFLRYVFIAFLAYTILNALFKKGFTAQYTMADFKMPAAWVSHLVGFFTGFLSVLLGVGGGTITMQFYRQAKMPMRNASACVSALIPVVAIVGTIGYLFTGWNIANLPQYAWGFIYLPALVGVVIGTLIGVPVGAKWVHKLPDRITARLFVVLVAIILMTMVF
jgi:uncharacterized membrane protein YfcA